MKALEKMKKRMIESGIVAAGLLSMLITASTPDYIVSSVKTKNRDTGNNKIIESVKETDTETETDTDNQGVISGNASGTAENPESFTIDKDTGNKTVINSPSGSSDYTVYAKDGSMEHTTDKYMFTENSDGSYKYEDLVTGDYTVFDNMGNIIDTNYQLKEE